MITRSCLLFLLLCVATAGCSSQHSEEASSSDELAGAGTGGAWLSLMPKQRGNPWEASRPAQGGAAVMSDDSASQSDERVLVEDYFSAQEIKLEHVGFAVPTGNSGGCMSLSCPRGDLLLVQAPSVDAEQKLTSAHGMRKVKGALSHAARDGPWASRLPTGRPSSLQIQLSAKAIADWAREQNARVESAGFIRRTGGRSGTCAVGDIAVVFPESAVSSERLQAQGWKPL